MNMDENALVEKEKKNKKIAFIALIVLCSISFLFGAIGGIASFINLVNGTNEQTEENMKTPQEKEFSDGVLNIMNGNTVIGTYKCQHSSCGYAYGFNDDNLYDLKTVEIGDYQIRKIINNKLVFLYDDDEDDSSMHRSNGVIVYDYTTSKVVKTYNAVKNYNKNDMIIFIVQDENNKWGVVKFDDNQVIEMVKPNYDYIGAFVPTGEQLNSQGFYAAKLGAEWFVIDINGGSNYSNSYSFPIVAYDGEMVVTKNSNSFDVYDTKGNTLYKGATDYIFPGGGLLVVNTSNQVTVFDAYAINKVFSHDYVQIGNVSAIETETGFSVKVNGEEVYSKANKNKSNRNKNGADYDMIVY